MLLGVGIESFQADDPIVDAIFCIMRSSIHVTEPYVLYRGAMKHILTPTIHDPDFIVFHLTGNHAKRVIDAIVVGGESCWHVQEYRSTDNRVSLIRATHPAGDVQGHIVIS